MPHDRDAELFASLLVRHLAGVCPVSADQAIRLYDHYELLKRWAARLNLTSIRGLEDAVVRHYCESVFLVCRLPSEAVSVLDVGSGAGFPGIPMAVVRPDCRFTLSESHQRKAVFLKEATRNWPHVQVLACRAETVRDPMDWVVSRAVRWEEVVPLARRIARRIGLLVGEEDATEAVTSAKVQWEEPVRLPWGKRRVLLVGTVSRETFHVKPT